MNLLELLIGQIPEAIYFSLFIIFTKQIKERRLLFTVLMIFEFVLLFNIAPYTVSSHAIFFAITYLVLKVIYKEKCQITDIFTFNTIIRANMGLPSQTVSLTIVPTNDISITSVAIGIDQ